MSVGAYLVRRLLWAIVLFLVLTFITFVIFFVMPSDAARTTVGRSGTASQDFRETANLSGTVFQQYGQFVWRVITSGALGESTSGKSVNSIIGTAAPVTVGLIVGGALFWLLISIPLGILSALRPRSLLDKATVIFVLIGISAHPLWLGLVLSYVFGFKLHWFPITGYCDVINPPVAAPCGGPVQWFYHMVLPWLTFSLLFAALYVRMIRAYVTEALNEDYVRTARAKGSSEWRVLRSHALRNALLPVATMFGMDLGMAIGGILSPILFVERVFSLPGLGGIGFQALQRRDLAIIAGIVVFTTITIVVLNLVVDLLYAFFDPRIRMASRQA